MKALDELQYISWIIEVAVKILRDRDLTLKATL